MILGVGMDLVEVARIRDIHSRFGSRFLRRILRLPEMEHCLLQSDAGPSIAARFAAKEAVSKAFGTGIGYSLGWQDIEIVRLASGQPTVLMHGKGAELLATRNGRRVHLSITHSVTHAAAVAIVET